MDEQPITSSSSLCGSLEGCEWMSRSFTSSSSFNWRVRGRRSVVGWLVFLGSSGRRAAATEMPNCPECVRCVFGSWRGSERNGVCDWKFLSVCRPGLRIRRIAELPCFVSVVIVFPFSSIDFFFEAFFHGRSLKKGEVAALF